MSAHRQNLLAWCELANLAKLPDQTAFTLNDERDSEWNRTQLLSRMRYEHLAVPGLNWEFATALRALSIVSEDVATRDALRGLALRLSEHGHSSSLIVALLAAGHTAQDAREARTILDS